MEAGQHITNALAGGAICMFIDDLGRPRLAYPAAVSAGTFRVCTGPPRRTKVTLEVDPAAEPIAGELRDTQGKRRGFAGWLGLLAALDHAFAAGRAQRTVDHPASPQTEPKSNDDH